MNNQDQSNDQAGTPAPPVMPSITVAVPTYRRPGSLEQALPRLLSQAEELSAAGSRVRILVVDNDPDQSARSVVDAFDHPTVRYVVEPTPGIAAARNRAMTEADSRLLVMIDDDEYPSDNWLASLVATWQSTLAAAVAGRIVATFDRTLTGLLGAGDFWERSRAQTGAEIAVAASGNLLLDLAQVRATGVRFSAQFGLTGGEDSLFSGQLVKHGGRIVWCDDSVALDPVPPERTTLKWVLTRALSQGNGKVRVALALAQGNRARVAETRFRLAAVGVARTLGGMARVVGGVVRPSARDRARGLRTTLRGVGTMAGALGWVFVEYSRTGSRWQRESAFLADGHAATDPQRSRQERRTSRGERMWLPVRLVAGGLPRQLERALSRFVWQDPRAVLDERTTPEAFRRAMSAFHLGGTFKITGAARHPQADALLCANLETSDAQVVDIGASDGSTSLDLIRQLDTTIGFSSYTVADLYLQVHATTGLGHTAFYGPTGDCILVVGRRLLAWPAMSARIGFWYRPLTRILSTGRREPVLLLNPQLRELLRHDDRVGFRVHDVFTPWPQGPVDVVKVANLLRRLYFTDDQLTAGLQAIRASLAEGGYLLLVDNPRIAGISERAGLYRRRGTRFVHVAETAETPEIADLVTALGRPEQSVGPVPQ